MAFAVVMVSGMVQMGVLLRVSQERGTQDTEHRSDRTKAHTGRFGRESASPALRIRDPVPVVGA